MDVAFGTSVNTKRDNILNNLHVAMLRSNGSEEWEGIGLGEIEALPLLVL